MVKRKKGRRRSTREITPEHELPGGFWRQVCAVLMVAVSIVLVMTWFGSGGTLLNDFHKFGFWLIGYATYSIPIKDFSYNRQSAARRSLDCVFFDDYLALWSLWSANLR